MTTMTTTLDDTVVGQTSVKSQGTGRVITKNIASIAFYLVYNFVLKIFQ